MTQTCFYVACVQSREIDVFSLDPQSGEVELRQRVVTDGAPQPLYVSDDQCLLLAGMRLPNSVQSFAIDPASGELALIGSAEAPGEPVYVSCDHDRKVAYCASYHGHSLSAFPLDAEGAPQAYTFFEADLPRAHAAPVDRSSRWLLLPLLGVDAIRVYRLRADASLAPDEPAMLSRAAGSGPRHLVFSPDNRQAYCLNELDGTIDRFAFDADRGHLTPLQTVSMLPPGFDAKPWAAELRLTPNGRFLYATERSASVIAAFVVAADTGELTLVDHFPTEMQPRGMGISPSGEWLVAVGQLSHRLTVYAIDPATGRLEARHTHTTGNDPIFVQFATLPD